MKNINTHCFRTVEDAGPYGFSGYRQFLRSRKLPYKPQFSGPSRTPVPTDMVVIVNLCVAVNSPLNPNSFFGGLQ